MTNVLLNAVSLTAGGGITLLLNILRRVCEGAGNHRYIALVPAQHVRKYASYANHRLNIETADYGSGLLGRALWEQTGLRTYIKSRKIDILISMGNIALFASPVPQILYTENDLYFSEYFERDLKARGLHRDLYIHRLKTRLARASIKQADINLTPTKAFADRIRSCDGLSRCRLDVLPFGFDPTYFTADDEPLPEELLNRLGLNEKRHRLLYVSHYNYFRNFETLLRALPLIKEQVEDIQLVLTTDLRRGAVYGGYDATRAAELIERLDLSSSIAMLGSLPYEKMHRLYRLCDAYVCPSYSESFGHPMLEAMASGLPVVSANMAVHREVCGDAALYFGVFDERALAAQCVRVLTDHPLSSELTTRGLERFRLFSWDEHIRGLTTLIESL
jgi:glycosyltransferase involved in cell wall biosynthesis